MKLRSPIVLTAIGVIATLVLAVAVVMVLLRAGGAKAVSDNAGLIGALVALGGVFTAQMVSIALEDQRTREARDLEVQRTRVAALQNYLKDVGELLIEKSLHQAVSGDSLSTVVRAQTMAVLEGLDPDRKRILLRFLFESKLIGRGEVQPPVVSLASANLTYANLREVHLSGAYLVGCRLSGANLSGAGLNSCRLAGVRLIGADLTSADLSMTNLDLSDLREANLFRAGLQRAEVLRADLGGADLTRADLSEADLSGTYLFGAKLSGANLSGANLQEAKELTEKQIKWTIGSNTTKLPEGFYRPELWSKNIDEQIEILREHMYGPD